jgi:short subunit dehydrogenase-like uncharacterized protein
MSGHVLLYGASGYSGRLVARELLARGVRPVLAGRDANKTAAVAAELGCEWHAARVDDPSALATMLDGAAVVLNAAGPFAHTALPIVSACLARGTDYLDLAGEVPVVARLAAMHAAARARGVMVMPSVGFDVVPTDALLAHVARRCPGGRALTSAVSRPAFLSPGSAKTLLENVDLGVVRRDGVITPLRLGSIERTFDFGNGPRPCLNVSFVDVVTAYFTTGIPNVTTFAEATPLLRLVPFGLMMASWLRTSVGGAVGRALADAVWSDPPGRTDTRAIRMTIVAECENGHRRARARLTTPEAYDFTGVTAAAVAMRVLGGDREPGFQTPARLFGPDFVLGLPGVVREDLDA